MNSEAPSDFKKKFSYLISIIASILLLITIAGLSIYLYRYLRATHIESLLREQKPFGILVINYKDQKVKNPDLTFFSVATFYPKSNRIGFISFFPQTRFTEHEAPLKEKVSLTSIDDIRNEISTLLNMPIPYYIISDYRSVSTLIDLVEGISYFMWDPDAVEKENNNLPLLEFTLDGSMVERVLTSTTENESAAAFEIFKHYNLILNLWQQHNDKWAIASNPAIFNLMYKSLDTNISYNELYKLSSIIMKGAQWVPFFMEIPVKRVFDSFVIDLDATALYLKNFIKNIESIENPFLTSMPKMEILNGTGKSNLARSFRNMLAKKGVIIVEFKNADRADYEESILLNISGNNYYLQSMEKTLGIKNIYSAINTSSFTDMILIIGKDYEKYFSK